MEFLTSAILSGLTYDLIKKRAAITFDVLRKKLVDWIFEDKDLQDLSKAINTATEIDKKTDKYWEAFLDSNEDIRSISKRIKKQIDTSVYQDLSNAHIEGGIVANVMENNTFHLNGENDGKKKYNV